MVADRMEKAREVAERTMARLCFFASLGPMFSPLISWFELEHGS
jgi:hypothetical protein